MEIVLLFLLLLILFIKLLIKRTIMVKFETNGKQGDAIIKLPTRIDEITPEYLKAITSHIKVADNYSLIALCHKEKLSNFVIAGRNNKGEMSTAVVPLFVKTGYCGNCFVSLSSY